MGRRFYAERVQKAWRRRHWYLHGRICGCHYCWKGSGFGRGPYNRAKQKRETQ